MNISRRGLVSALSALPFVGIGARNASANASKSSMYTIRKGSLRGVVWLSVPHEEIPLNLFGIDKLRNEVLSALGELPKEPSTIFGPNNNRTSGRPERIALHTNELTVRDVINLYEEVLARELNEIDAKPHLGTYWCRREGW